MHTSSPLCRRHAMNVAVAVLAGALLLPVAPPDASAADERLVELVRDELDDSGVDVSAVTFTELDGVVTLDGRVENGRVREAVIDTVRRTHGVVDVVDRMTSDY